MVGDKVAAIKDIRTFDNNLKIRNDAIPSGTIGEVIFQDDENVIVSVLFENGIRGTFADGAVDTIENSIVVGIDREPVDALRRRQVAAAGSVADVALVRAQREIRGSTAEQRELIEGQLASTAQVAEVNPTFRR